MVKLCVTWCNTKSDLEEDSHGCVRARRVLLHRRWMFIYKCKLEAPQHFHLSAECLYLKHILSLKMTTWIIWPFPDPSPDTVQRRERGKANTSREQKLKALLIKSSDESPDGWKPVHKQDLDPIQYCSADLHSYLSVNLHQGSKPNDHQGAPPHWCIWHTLHNHKAESDILRLINATNNYISLFNSCSLLQVRTWRDGTDSAGWRARVRGLVYTKLATELEWWR